MPDKKRNLRAQKERALRMIKKRQPRYQDCGISRKIAHSMNVLLNSSLPFSTIRPRVSLTINTQGSGILFRNSEKTFAPLCRRMPPRRQPIQTTSAPQTYKLAPLEYLKTPGSHSNSVATRTQRRTAPAPDFDFNLSPIRPIRLPYHPEYYTWPNHDSCLPVRFSSLLKVWHGFNLKRPVNNQEERSFAIQKALARLLDANAATQGQKQASRDACKNLEYSDARVVECNGQEGPESTNADYENWTVHAVSPEKKTPLVSLRPVPSTPSEVRTFQVERELTEATTCRTASSSSLSPPTPSPPSPYNYSETHPSFSPPYIAGHHPPLETIRFTWASCIRRNSTNLSARKTCHLLPPTPVPCVAFWSMQVCTLMTSEQTHRGERPTLLRRSQRRTCLRRGIRKVKRAGRHLRLARSLRLMMMIIIIWKTSRLRRRRREREQTCSSKTQSKSPKRQLCHPLWLTKGADQFIRASKSQVPSNKTTSEHHERPIDTLIGKDQTDQLESATTSGGLREQEAQHRTSLNRPDQSQLVNHHQAVYQDTARQFLIQQPDPVTHVIAGALDTLALLLSALALVVSVVFVAMVTVGLAALFEDGARLLVSALS